MKIKNVFKLVFVLFANTLYAQDAFAPIGSKWYYEHFEGSSAYLTIIESTKDSVVQDKNCKLLLTKTIYEQSDNGYVYYWDTSLVSEDFVYSNGDTVFSYNKCTEAFDPLYVFTVLKDYTYTVRNEISDCDLPYSTSFEYKVDSLSSIIYDGTSYKLIYNSPTLNSQWTFNDCSSVVKQPIIENIGSAFFLWGDKNVVMLDESGGGKKLRCYKNNSTLYKHNGYIGNCDSLRPLYKTPISQHNDENDIVVSNPFFNSITIHLKDKSFNRFMLLDNSGQIILSGTATDIKTNTLKSGVYFLTVYFDETLIKTFKLIRK